MGKDKPLPKPVWWKNTFFWFGGILFVLSIVGMFDGANSIRDPGQVHEPGLAWVYLGGAVVMLVNGYLTHGQAVRSFAEHQEDK
ncbi:MAG TPA: hypothetical protein VNI20_00275 [Fimbriimonadaceae bacterium]|nr:hypothetical protein [Fimbriimonadaceae bacterium]